MTTFLIVVASLFLLALVAFLSGVLICYARNAYTLPQSVLYFMDILLNRFLWRSRLPKRIPVEEGQGAVIVCNHRSSVDPFFLQVCSDRPVHWMVAREFCEHPAFRWFLKQCEAIPVNRGGIDTAATKAAIRLASQGGLVGMLPEGRINMTEQFMLPVRPGAVLVALKARVPILPCYIEGAPYNAKPWSPLFMPAKVRLVFGPAVDLSPYYDRQAEDGLVGQLMLEVTREIARLAGQPDFEPQLAGRHWKPTDQEVAQAVRDSRAREK